MLDTPLKIISTICKVNNLFCLVENLFRVPLCMSEKRPMDQRVFEDKSLCCLKNMQNMSSVLLSHLTSECNNVQSTLGNGRYINST